MAAARKRAGFSAAARQRRMGPAPFASFEQDLSDDLGEDSSPPDVRAPLPGILEDGSPAGAASLGVVGLGVGGLHTPSTPRIDISRASSSSHHEEEGESSRGSTPERELFAGQGGLGFKEEGTAELRSSTEELDFHEDAAERERRRQRLQRRKERGRGSMQPVLKYELEAQSEKERKDSACSLPVSGRTSRLSSVGSAASGASAASAASALSVGSRAMSAVSAATSRSPSPHRMLLETSFCGSKPIPSQSVDLDSPCKHETESLEKVLLARSTTDPTKVLMAPECTPTSPAPPDSLDLGHGATKTARSFPAVVHHPPEPPEETHHYPRVVHQIPKVNKKKVVTEPPVQEIIVSEVIESVVVQTDASEDSVPVVSPVAQQEAPPSPKLPRNHAALRKEESASEKGSRTPSPSTSRKSSFTSLFRRTESPLSPESPTAKRKNVFTAKLKEASEGLRERSRSRSKSSERGDGKTRKDSRNKSVFSSLFKKKNKRSSSSGSADDVQSPPENNPTPQEAPKLTDAIGNVEFTFDERRPVIHERVVSEDREEREAAGVVEVPPEVEIPPEKNPALLGEQLGGHDSSDSELERSSRSGEPEGGGEADHERKGLVMQDSFEDELPFVPTTLPQERSIAVHIVPVKQRLCPEVCATERPRSTTPINPAHLEEFVAAVAPGPSPAPEGERLRISLPREDSIPPSRPLKSPRRVQGAKTWVEFAETSGILGGGERRPSMPSPVSPPPLPPRAPTPQQSKTPPPAKSWVNFEAIPERRKPPKKIQTLPARGPLLEAEGGGPAYVKPEECSVDAFGLLTDGLPRCECHGEGGTTARGRGAEQPEEKAPDRNSVLSDSSYDLTTYTQPEGGLKPMKPFGMDLDVHSNRSSIISQEEAGSPDSPPPNGGL